MPALTQADGIYLGHQRPIRHLRSFINVSREPFVMLNENNSEVLPHVIRFLLSWKCARDRWQSSIMGWTGRLQTGQRGILWGLLEASYLQCDLGLGCHAKQSKCIRFRRSFQRWGNREPAVRWRKQNAKHRADWGKTSGWNIVLLDCGYVNITI